MCYFSFVLSVLDMPPTEQSVEAALTKAVSIFDEPKLTYIQELNKKASIRTWR